MVAPIENVIRYLLVRLLDQTIFAPQDMKGEIDE